MYSIWRDGLNNLPEQPRNMHDIATVLRFRYSELSSENAKLKAELQAQSLGNELKIQQPLMEKTQQHAELTLRNAELSVNVNILTALLEQERAKVTKLEEDMSQRYMKKFNDKLFDEIIPALTKKHTWTSQEVAVLCRGFFNLAWE